MVCYSTQYCTVSLTPMKKDWNYSDKELFKRMTRDCMALSAEEKTRTSMFFYVYSTQVSTLLEYAIYCTFSSHKVYVLVLYDTSVLPEYVLGTVCTRSLLYGVLVPSSCHSRPHCTDPAVFSFYSRYLFRVGKTRRLRSTFFYHDFSVCVTVSFPPRIV
jgi:hypothetical protein